MQDVTALTESTAVARQGIAPPGPRSAFGDVAQLFDAGGDLQVPQGWPDDVRWRIGGFELSQARADGGSARRSDHRGKDPAPFALSRDRTAAKTLELDNLPDEELETLRRLFATRPGASRRGKG